MPRKSKKDEFLALIERCNVAEPAKADMVKLRETLDSETGIALARANQMIEHTFNKVLSGSSGLVVELYKRQVAEQRKSMDYEMANAYIRMLIDQVILSSLRLNQTEQLHDDRLRGNHSTEAGVYWDSRLSNAQRRFLRACEALAKAKKLLSEAELYTMRKDNIKSAKTKRSLDIYKSLSN